MFFNKNIIINLILFLLIFEGGNNILVNKFAN